VSLLTTAATAAYQYRATDALPFYALKRRKAQKQRSFRAKSTYGHCIKDEVLIDPALDTGALLANFGESFVSRVCEYDESIPEQIGRARFYAALRPIIQAENLADKISTRDFSDYRIELMEPGIFPVGKH
jgi:hypothetical protein